MFYCKECSTNVQILLSNLHVVGYPTVSNGKLKVSHVTLLPKQQGTVKIRTKFYCPTCSKELDLVKVICECSHCFGVEEVSNLYVFPSYPGIYCEEHREDIVESTGLEPEVLASKIQTMEIKGG